MGTGDPHPGEAHRQSHHGPSALSSARLREDPCLGLGQDAAVSSVHAGRAVLGGDGEVQGTQAASASGVQQKDPSCHWVPRAWPDS